MPEQKHTPGPWEYLGDAEERECRVRQATSVRRGNGYFSELTICESVSSKANAKLIAAAPDLLTAAVEVMKGLNERIDAAVENRLPTPIFVGVAALHEAIAKATE